MNPDQDLTECRECGETFNLAAQNYYDNLCPACVEPERSWPICMECDERIPPDERAHKTVRGAARDPATVRVAIHESCKSNSRPRPP